MITPIIFLDMDGVMNPMEDWDPEVEWKKLNKPPPILDELSEEDYQILVKLIYRTAPRCVALLNEITDKTGALIVISSTWRKGRDLTFFDGYGLTGNIIDKTPILDDKERGDEIAAWLEKHPQYTRFVILDDDSDMSDLIDNLIQTDTDMGLTREITDKVLEYFISLV